jgi:hypothetical protein
MGTRPIRPWRRAAFDAFVRCLAAALGAALAAGLIMGLNHARGGEFVGAASLAVGVTMVAFVVALAHALLLGWPFALLLRRLRRETLPMMLAGGAIIGAVPMTFLDDDPFFVAVCAVCGAVGAAAFHLAGPPMVRPNASP